MLQNAAEQMPRSQAPRPGPENVLTLNLHRASFDPEVITAMTAAYHAVLAELRLSDREDASRALPWFES
jgi:hypothetical protein